MMYQYIVVAVNPKNNSQKVLFNDEAEGRHNRELVFTTVDQQPAIYNKGEEFGEEGRRGNDDFYLLPTTYMFDTEVRAVAFAEWLAPQRPGWEIYLANSTRVFCTERPKVIRKTVTKEGVMPE